MNEVDKQLHRCAGLLHSTERYIKHKTIIDAHDYSLWSVFYTVYLTFTPKHNLKNNKGE